MIKSANEGLNWNVSYACLWLISQNVKFIHYLEFYFFTGSSAVKTAGPVSNQEGSEILKKQEELFNSMEMQYEVARVATHTHRGVGLGFGTFQYPR